MNSHNLWDDLWGSPEPEKPLKSSGYNSVTMANYFQSLLVKQSWYKGFGIGNIQALSGHLARWKKSGLSKEDLYSMMDSYMKIAHRSANPGWQDFVAKRDQLISVVRVVDTEPEDDYDEEKAMREYLARRNK